MTQGYIDPRENRCQAPPPSGTALSPECSFKGLSTSVMEDYSGCCGQRGLRFLDYPLWVPGCSVMVPPGALFCGTPTDTFDVGE